MKENDSVELTCSSNSNPPANSYQWFSSNGTMLAKSPTYKLERVSRQTEAISCTAFNTEGKNSSAPRKLNYCVSMSERLDSIMFKLVLLVKDDHWL